LRVDGLADGWWRSFEEFGHWAEEGDWIVVAQIVPERIPDLVAQVVALGGRIEAVIPEHQSLEERFLELLGES
jgi:hypothetical protein